MGNKIMRINEYAVIKMYVDRIIQKQPAKIVIPMEMHLVNDFKTNLLTNNETFKL